VTYSARVFVQDTATGRTDAVQTAIAWAENAVAYDAVDAAIAYATRSGVELLSKALHTAARWPDAEKRWLVSIDYGITEPRALEALAAMPRSSVRVPNGLAVLANRRLNPPTTFHTKGYLFRRSGARVPLALVVGSANLSVSALGVGAESVTAQVWSGRLSRSERSLLRAHLEFGVWFNEAWKLSDDLAAVLAGYSSVFRRGRRPAGGRDDQVASARAYSAAASADIPPGYAAQLAVAKAIWFQTETLYHNRGAGKPGNQLDTPRGTRVFFGFPAASVPRNTVLGHVMMRASGSTPVERSVRFGNNFMDKVNLPIPGRNGPVTYDNSYVIFERQGPGRFDVITTDRAGLRRRARRANRTVQYEMAGGREYGLFF